MPAGPRIDFGALKQPSGKVVTAFAVRGDLDITDARSNTFELEWPKGSGTLREFPEVDRVGLVSGRAGTHQATQGAARLSRSVDDASGLGGTIPKGRDYVPDMHCEHPTTGSMSYLISLMPQGIARCPTMKAACLRIAWVQDGPESADPF